MKTRRHITLDIAHAAFYFALTLPAWATPIIIERGFGATLVCPFTVTGNHTAYDSPFIEVSCYSDTGCTTQLGTASWGTPQGAGQQTFLNGVHTLSNEAMAAAALTQYTATQCIKIVIHSQESTTATLNMQATVSNGVFTCTGGPYTLDITNL